MEIVKVNIRCSNKITFNVFLNTNIDNEHSISLVLYERIQLSDRPTTPINPLNRICTLSARMCYNLFSSTVNK